MTQFDMTPKIFIKVGYFDLGSGERNLIQFLIQFLLMFFCPPFKKLNFRHCVSAYFSGITELCFSML